jgi:1,2-diacylglycerol 3-alpha-glucosyltransferase
MQLKHKLLIATDSFLPRWDGPTRFLLNILPSIKNNLDITIVCPKFKGDIKFKDATILRLPIEGKTYYYEKPNLKSINRLVREHDIIFANTLGPIGQKAIKCGGKLDKPVLNYVHSIQWNLLSKNRFLEFLIRYREIKKIKKLYENCSMLISPSIHTAKTLEKQNIKTPKVVAKIGIDLDKFKPPEKKDSAKRKLSIDPEKKVIGFVGRLTKNKDINTLYRAFKKLELKHKNLLLLIVGRGNLKLERKFKHDENIRQIKLSNNIVPYLQAMDMFVQPSLTETSSLATLEAMACAIPVITTKTGDLKKYIKDKDNGLLFSRKNDTLLALKIEWLLKEEFVRSTIGLNARETVDKIFNLNDSKKAIKRIFASF